MSIIQTAKSGLANVTNGRNALDNLCNKSILKGKTAMGLSGFLFDYEGETNISFVSDITDHFIEDNTVINDHVAQHPLKITLRGFVSELVLASQSGLMGLLNSLTNNLSIIPAYLGNYTPQMLQKIQSAVTTAQNVTNQIDTAISRTKNIIGLFDKASPATTKQQKAYNDLSVLWETKSLVTLETPFQFFNNLVIETLTFVQPEETKMMSDIIVVLKQVRFANMEFTKFDQSIFKGRKLQQQQAAINNGKSKGKDVKASNLYNQAHFKAQ